jgi:hypothetical protein
MRKDDQAGGVAGAVKGAFQDCLIRHDVHAERKRFGVHGADIRKCGAASRQVRYVFGAGWALPRFVDQAAC